MDNFYAVALTRLFQKVLHLRKMLSCSLIFFSELLFWHQSTCKGRSVLFDIKSVLKQIEWKTVNKKSIT